MFGSLALKSIIVWKAQKLFLWSSPTKTQLFCLDERWLVTWLQVCHLWSHNLKIGSSKGNNYDLPQKDLLWCSVNHHISQIQNIVIQRISLMTQMSLTYHWTDKCSQMPNMILHISACTKFVLACMFLIL